MKSIIKPILGCSIALLSSCNSYTPTEEMAIETVKSMCKSPSSFKLINVSEVQIDPYIKLDTAFYYRGLYRTSYEVHNLPDVLFDSIYVTKQYWCGYTAVTVEFDAQNSFGAMMRGKETIRIDNGRIIFDTKPDKVEVVETKKYESTMQFKHK